MSLAGREFERSCVVTVNAGSSSIKFALFRGADSLDRVLSGKIERIGLPGTPKSVTDVAARHTKRVDMHAADHFACVLPLMEVLDEKIGRSSVRAIGHRIVHGGMQYREPQRLSSELLTALGKISPLYLGPSPRKSRLLRRLRNGSPSCLRSRASIPRSIETCRLSRRGSRFPGITQRPVCSAMGFTVCPMPT